MSVFVEFFYHVIMYVSFLSHEFLYHTIMSQSWFSYSVSLNGHSYFGQREGIKLSGRGVLLKLEEWSGGSGSVRGGRGIGVAARFRPAVATNPRHKHERGIMVVVV